MKRKYRTAFAATIAWLFFCLALLSCGQHPVPSSANKETITKYFEEVINSQKLDQMDEFFSQDYIWHQMDGTDTHRSQDTSHVAMIRFLFGAIPDLRYTIDHAIAEGDMVAVNATVTGTAKREMFGLPAGQGQVRFRQMFFFRLANGKITEEWEVVDVDGMMAQLRKQ